jgi:hypothetical protein
MCKEMTGSLKTYGVHQKPPAIGVPERSPIQMLTMHNVA